jgi:hypothetical protein
MSIAIQVLRCRAAISRHVCFDLFDGLIAPHFDLIHDLKRAANLNDLGAVQYLISVGANLNPIIINTLYIDLVSGSSIMSLPRRAMLQYFESLGVSRRARRNALCIAASAGSTDSVSYLLERGLDARDLHDALIEAVDYHRFDVVKLLVEAGAAFRARNDHALRLAAAKGDLKIVKYLISAGADLHADNDYALRLSAYYGHLDVVKHLVAAGAHVRAIEDFAVRWAAHNDMYHTVEYLVSVGADLCARNREVFAYAAQKNNRACLTFCESLVSIH